jgi:formamidopyrimidine-DNA glycosylase
MPELPEMQALAERLDEALAGSELEGIVPIQFSAAKTFDPSPESLVGRRLESVGRRAKYLVFDLGGPRLLIHLSQGGRVDVESPPKTTRPKGGVARFRFAGRPAILVKEFGTQRKAGWWVLAEGDEGPLEGLGPEPYSDAFEKTLMQAKGKRRLHSYLRDQRVVAGIGRGYSDEILHDARLSPYAPVGSLSEEERWQLLSSIRATLDRGLDLERKRTGGLPTKLSDRWTIHGQHGRPCPRCGEDLRRVSFEDYEITYCPRCQTGGKVLADRRMSRLIK